MNAKLSDVGPQGAVMGGGSKGYRVTGTAMMAVALKIQV